MSSSKKKMRWQRMADPTCTCVANVNTVHVAGCAWVGRFVPSSPPQDPRVFTFCGVIEPVSVGILLGAHGKPIPIKQRRHPRQRVPPKIPPYRFKLQFQFTRPVNIELWKKIEAPPGWRKCPTTKSKQLMYRGVRFQCDDLKYALTPEQIQLLHMKLLLSLEGTF